MNALLTLFTKPDFRQSYASLSQPFFFLLLYLLFTTLYDRLSDETLRIMFHNQFIALCVQLIQLIPSSDQVIAVQNSIITHHINLEMVRTCDGSTTFFLIASAIIVFRSTLKSTLTGLTMGFALVMTLNFLRILSLYFLIHYNPAWFASFHHSIAPFLLLTIGCGYFALWAYHANKATHG